MMVLLLWMLAYLGEVLVMDDQRDFTTSAGIALPLMMVAIILRWLALLTSGAAATATS